MSDSDKISIAIIGSGAVGSYYGARLVQGGCDVHFLMRSDFEAVKKQGMQISSCAGDFNLIAKQLQVYNNAMRMPQVDWVIVTLKTTENHLFDQLIRPLIKPDTKILTLQNGLGNEQQLADRFGAERILGGMAFTCINRIGPGKIDHTAHGYIRLGLFAEGNKSPAQFISDTFNRCQVPCDVLADLNYGRWEKLLWNIPFNGLSTILDQTTDVILSTEQGDKLVRRIMQEVLLSARANGANLEDELIEKNIKRTLEMGAYRTSMHIDRQQGRDLEVEAILGQPMRAGMQKGVANPCMQMLYELAFMVWQNRRNMRSPACEPTEPRA